MHNHQLCLLMLESILLSMSACIYTAAAMPNGRLTGIMFRTNMSIFRIYTIRISI